MTHLGGNLFRVAVGIGGVAVALAASRARAQPPNPGQASSQPPFAIIEEFEPLAPTGDRGDVLSTLRSVARRFDFDDLQTGPNALPPNFYRYVAPSQGFPPFGEMRVVRGEGHIADGQNKADTGAIEFDLQGGSMSARIGTSVIPVLPFADYVVACRVRTRDLQHARARLAAWLCDATGRMIEGSRVDSRPADADNRWDTLSLEMHGNFAGAADLVFELQLIQPTRGVGPPSDDANPRMHDVRGRAWFDDVTISHLPRVVLSMTLPGNIVPLGQAATFAVQVNELATRELTARLRVVNLDGEIVHDQSFPAPRGREPVTLSMPVRTCGWFRAVLDVASDQRVARRRWVDFVVLPADSRSGAAGRPFGVVLGIDADAEDAEMAARLRSGLAIVPAWDQRTTRASLPQINAARRNTIEQLLRSDIDVAFAMREVPEELARAAGSQGRSNLDVLSGDSRLWRPYVDDLLMHFGLTINRWIVGECNDINSPDARDALRKAEIARQSLAAFVPSPMLHLVWPVEQQPVGVAQPAAVALQVPANIPPASIGEFLAPWLASDSRSTLVALELLPASRYSPRQCVIDALLRGLQAWRGGAPMTVIDQPWRQSSGSNPAPDAVFAAWRTLNAQLAGRRFVSELALGPDVHVWALAGRDSDDAAVIAWCDRDRSVGTSGLDIQLADRAVSVSDAFGNTSTIEPEQRLHHLELGDTPVFVTGVSLELVLFRSGVAIEPAFIPAASKIHEHEIVIQNPWDTMVAGTLRLTGDDELQVIPAVQEFAIAARGVARLPIQIIPQRGILAGPRAIAAEITINADRLHTLKMDLNVEVGLKDIEVNVAWYSVRNPFTGADDLLVSPAVTNRSDRPVNLDVDLLAEGVSQMRRTIAGLQPGQTQTRTFRIAGGATALAGKAVRLGVAQRDGVARLNKIITIGAITEHDAVVSATPSP